MRHLETDQGLGLDIKHLSCNMKVQQLNWVRSFFLFVQCNTKERFQEENMDKLDSVGNRPSLW